MDVPARTLELSDPSLYRLWVPEHVRFADLDPLGHANNNAIGVYFESGRVAFHDRLDIRGRLPGCQIVAAKLTIEFKAEVHRPAELRIGVGLVRLGRTSWTTGSAVFIGDRCMATSECVTVLIDDATRRPTPVPDAVRAEFETYRLG